MNTTRKWAVIGGTFDPVHIGHLILAESALDFHRFDRVLFMLTPRPPHKPDQALTDYDLRLAMLQAAIAGHPQFAVTTIEREREGPHFSFESLRLLRERHAADADAWYFLMGADSAMHIRAWREPREILRLANLCVIPRPGSDLTALKSVLLAEPALVDEARAETIVADAVPEAPVIGVSSTEIRRRVSQGRSIRFLVPDAVRAIIGDTKIYREAGAF